MIPFWKRYKKADNRTDGLSSFIRNRKALLKNLLKYETILTFFII